MRGLSAIKPAKVAPILERNHHSSVGSLRQLYRQSLYDSKRLRQRLAAHDDFDDDFGKYPQADWTEQHVATVCPPVLLDDRGRRSLAGRKILSQWRKTLPQTLEKLFGERDVLLQLLIARPDETKFSRFSSGPES